MTAIYDKNEVKRAASLTDLMTSLGCVIHGNRTQAVWRGGKDDNVQIFHDADGDKWKDFACGDESSSHGDVIDLYRIAHNTDFMTATRALAEQYNVPPKSANTAKSRGRPVGGGGKIAHLKEDGYELKNEYKYTDESGALLYSVQRWERTINGEREKTFLQVKADGTLGISGVRRVLYNLPAVIKSDNVVIVEGEKDADTLIREGFVATTNSGGGSQWQADFDEVLAGKGIVILTDNDDVGKKHGETIAARLATKCPSVKLVNPSKLPKGDVTDYIEKEQGTIDALIEMVCAANELACKADDPKAIARLANAEPFRNYYEVKPGEGERKSKRIARDIGSMIDDVHARCCGFPKVIGSELFDFSKQTSDGVRKIISLESKYDFKTWLDLCTNHQSVFAQVDGAPSVECLMSGLRFKGERYEVVSSAPWYPARDDAFLAFGNLPEPEQDAEAFEAMIDQFLPATPADRILMKAIFMSPMFFDGQPKPCWAIDTIDAQASGKTTIAKICALLYGEEIIPIDINHIDTDYDRLTRRLLSAEARARRIALMDNVERSVKSERLADLVTASAISGLRPYGHGEETRKNDITYVMTMNGAAGNSDAASRTYTLTIKAPDKDCDKAWEKNLRAFVTKNRWQILADIYSLMEHAPRRTRAGSRFGSFDSTVLSGACRNDAEWLDVSARIEEKQAALNDDDERAQQCVEAIRAALLNSVDNPNLKPNPLRPCVLRAADVETIFARTSGEIKRMTAKSFRRLVNAGRTKNIVKGVDRVHAADKVFGRVRVIVYLPDGVADDQNQYQLITFNEAWRSQKA